MFSWKETLLFFKKKSLEGFGFEDGASLELSGVCGERVVSKRKMKKRVCGLLHEEKYDQECHNRKNNLLSWNSPKIPPPEFGGGWDNEDSFQEKKVKSIPNKGEIFFLHWYLERISSP